MATISIGTLRYDIVSDTTSFVRGIKATRKQKKEADRVFREGLSPMQKHNMALLRMMDLYKKGMITKKQVLAQQVKIKATLRQEQTAVRMAGMQVDQYTGSYARASRGLAAYTAGVNRNTRAIVRNRAVGGNAGGMGGGGGGGMRGAANGNRLANIGGSFGSAMGFGGAGAGMGRMAGLGFGTMAFGGAAVLMGKLVKEAAILETALIDMQVIMGDDAAGAALVNNLRDIARETPLTSKALIKGAQTLLGYGLSAEGLEDTMYRIGEIAGGDTARMDSLTRAFAQVQSAGKLMGQEMLQLVNAGFPVAEIAKAAGVSMEDFRKEMEAGNIKASHLTEAMVNLTSAGGMMEGRLARQADTIKGKWITATGAIEQKMAEMGMKSSGFWKDVITNFGEFSVGFLGGVDTITEAWADMFGGMEEGFENSSRYMDQSGKQMSWYARTVQDWADTITRWTTGATQEEIEATRARDRRMNMASNSFKKEAEERQKQIDGRKKIKDSVDAEVQAYQDSQKKKAKAIYDEMKPEEDLAAMRKRHWKERWAARREGTRLRATSGNDAADSYLKSTVELQRAEEAKMLKQMADKKKELQLQRAREVEDARYQREKENIKKSVGVRKKQIEKEEKDRQDAKKRSAKAYGDAGKYASQDGYAASAAITAEYQQNLIQNKADDTRERQLEELKALEKEAERKADIRHKQRMKLLDNSANNNGKP